MDVLVAVTPCPDRHMPLDTIVQYPVPQCASEGEWLCGLPMGHGGLHVFPKDINAADPRFHLRAEEYQRLIESTPPLSAA